MDRDDDARRAWDAVCAALAERCERHDVPGAAVGVLADGVTRTSAWGVRSVEDPVPVSPRTLFRVASITKTVTAVALLRQVEAGRVELDAPVRTYLPALGTADADTAAEVTVRHLLTHRSGWAPEAPDPGRHTDQDDAALARYVEGLGEPRRIFPLGRFYSYNNVGFAVLGRIVEVVTGRPYETVVRDDVLRPFGMHASGFGADHAVTRPLALGHRVRPVRVWRPWGRARGRAPVGGLFSTVEDLLRYAAGLLDGGAGVLRPETVRAMWTPEADAEGNTDHVGLAWNIDAVGDGVRLVGHRGYTTGNHSLLAMVPAHGFALVVLTNGDSGIQVTRAVERVALRELLGLGRPRRDDGRSADVDPAAYTGTYGAGTSTVEASVVDGVLVLRDDAHRVDARVRFTTADAGYADDTDHSFVRFVRDDDGAVRWLRVGDSVFVRE
ncbi:MAG: beta-lactamase family protein [Streptosporangiales bacterium]|nr:beta-lactamase family protein [Streptosporangiales bacterium]